ncbi:piggyBac transposable element-derived protein 3-like, partial [Zophobas morio]|uniref:piggyBac transposable element-derived protein 3-like n=1 Tax=Zophobas morio TaxID=2755281 RepID=UPI0030829B30
MTFTICVDSYSKDIADKKENEIPSIRFYGQKKMQISLQSANQAISALQDDNSEIEDDEEETEEGYDQSDDNQDNNDDQDNCYNKHANFDNNEETSDEEPVASTSKRQKKKTTIAWRKTKFVAPNTSFIPENDDDNSTSTPDSPFEYFSRYFPLEIFTQLAEYTNIYSVFKSGKSLNTTENEIRRLVALHIIMGIINYPRLRLYWAPQTQFNLVRDIGLSRNRFESLRNNLHITDVNKDKNEKDKLWKVRPIIKHFEKRCEELQTEENCCLDETIIPFKGQLSIKQYIRGKPNPWGVKVYNLCGESGIIYRSIVYQGSTTLPELNHTFSATTQLVLHLAERLPGHRGHKLYFDNFFNSLEVLQQLSKKGIFAAGTVRPNRLGKCILKTDNELKKMGRGTSEYCVTQDNDIVAVKWYDNKAVNMASNFVAKDPLDQVRRWDKKQRTPLSIERPAIIRLYNKSMGGVDKSDFLVALYRTFIRSKKWTLRIIFHYFNIAVCNSWLEYRRDASKESGSTKQKDLLQFTFDVAEALAFSKALVRTPKVGRPRSRSASPLASSAESPKRQKQCTPVEDVRFDNLAHWPIYVEGHEQRCKLET